MFTWMRTHQRRLMLVITVLTIISFVWLYSAHDPSRLQQDEVLRIYNRNVSYSDFQRSMRKLNLAIRLGLIDYASQLAGGSEEGAAEFAVNSMVLEHEGRALGLRPDDTMVADKIATLPIFQTGGQFDPAKFESIYQSDFAPNGFTRSEIDEIVRNAMIFDRIKKVIDSVPAVTDADVAYFGRAFQPVNGAAIVFELSDYTKAAAPTDQRIAEYLKANAARFQTPEWRTARYVSFPLPAESEKLDSKARIAAQQKAATASDTFAEQAAAVGFEKAAKDAGLKIETTLPFDRNGNIKPMPGMETAATALAPVAQALAPAVFALTQTEPVSRVIEGKDAFLVADLGKVDESRPMTIDEARPQIVQEITDTGARAALQKSVTESLAKLRAALKSGKSFAEAAGEAGMKTTPFTGISLADEAAPADQRRYASAAILVNENEISGFQPDFGGGFAVWVEKRMPMDEKKFADKKGEIVSSVLSQRQTVLFRDWLQTAQKDSGLAFAQQNRG